MATDGKAFNKAFGRCLMLRGSRGFTLVEILVTLAIFTIILGGFFSAYLSQLKHTTRETKGAEAEIELGIAKGVLLRDLELAGYGLADDYSAVTSSTFAPLAAKGNDGGTWSRAPRRC
jgi:prepilin-type N-terminal cleavage/methylation domain-containing protein